MNYFLIFMAGYLTRHGAGWLFHRYFQEFPAKEITPGSVQDVVISYDRGKSWQIRTTGGAWVKISRETATQIIAFYDTDQPTTPDQPADTSGTPG